MHGPNSCFWRKSAPFPRQLFPPSCACAPWNSGRPFQAPSFDPPHSLFVSTWTLPAFLNLFMPRNLRISVRLHPWTPEHAFLKGRPLAIPEVRLPGSVLNKADYLAFELNVRRDADPAIVPRVNLTLRRGGFNLRPCKQSSNADKARKRAVPLGLSRFYQFPSNMSRGFWRVLDYILLFFRKCLQIRMLRNDAQHAKSALERSTTVNLHWFCQVITRATR